jgi:predicted aspartyl protease
MGRFAVEMEVANNRDLVKAEDGDLPEEKVRRLRIRGIVDSGATRLVLPKAIADQLGLKPTGKAAVRYAAGRSAVRSVVDNVHVTLLGRSSIFKAALEPKRESALIGAVVLEDLDFLVDSTYQRLVPRDPKMIVSEAE